MESMSRICREEWQSDPTIPTIPVILHQILTLVWNHKMGKIRNSTEEVSALPTIWYQDTLTWRFYDIWNDRILLRLTSKLPRQCFLSSISTIEHNVYFNFNWFSFSYYYNTNRSAKFNCKIVWTCRLQKWIST